MTDRISRLMKKTSSNSNLQNHTESFSYYPSSTSTGPFHDLYDMSSFNPFSTISKSSGGSHHDSEIFYYKKNNTQYNGYGGGVDERDGQSASSRRSSSSGNGCGFEQDHYCRPKCSARHPSKAIICRNSLLNPENGCSGQNEKNSTKCKYQHPNTVTIEGQLKKVFLQVSQKLYDHIDAQEKADFIRNNIVKCPFRMDCDKVCPFPPFMCQNEKCNLQHYAQQGDAQTIQNQYRTNPNAVGQLVPASDHDIDYVSRIWTERKGSHKIVRVQKVVNPKLESLFEKRKKELNEKAMEIPDGAFHGTSQEIIKIIVEQGFDGSKSINQAWGPGTYFASDPTTAVSYAQSKSSKQVLMCRLVIDQSYSDCNYVPSNNWFVMQNTSGILPIFVITFQ
nr:unnamed protein product [Naegleria fowleri]